MLANLFTAISLLSLALYMGVNALWTQEFTRIQRGGRRLAFHGVATGVWACFGLVGLVTLAEPYFLGAAYLMMPMVYLVLVMAASQVMRVRYGRPLLPANKNNMQDPSMRDARLLDYLLFLVVHVVPLTVPPAVLEGIWGVQV